MPKLACPCGFVHNLSPIPDDGWHTVRDRDFETFLAAELENQATPDSAESGMHFLGSLYECAKCGRIMWEKPGEKSFAIYCKE